MTALADRFDPRHTAASAGLLAEFQEAAVLDAADIHVACRLGKLGGESDERVLLAAALTVRAARLGSVCLDLAAAPTQIVPEEDVEAEPLAAGGAGPPALPWPDPEEWLAACEASPLVEWGPSPEGGHPLQLRAGLLYLDRYWQQEQLVAGELTSRAERSLSDPPGIDEPRFSAALDRLFPPDRVDEAFQREAASVAAQRWLSVLAGGPGTGKTTTVARILALLADQPGPPPLIALAAPTGKAAARLAEAVRDAVAELPAADQHRLGELTASTLHRLLGFRPGSRSRFAHHAGNRLAYDVVVVDESSMVSLTLMARLLDAVRPDARLVLVGDPEQLASVEAGAVLGDIVDAGQAAGVERGVDSGIVVLGRSWRFTGRIAELAAAIQAGDADSAVAILRTPAEDVSFIETDAVAAGSTPVAGGGVLGGLRDEVVGAARRLIAAAAKGDAASALTHLSEHRLLCAHRHGPYGADRWGQELERWIDGALNVHRSAGEWYPGRPLLVTANDYEVKLFNGDTGVIVSDGEGSVTAAFGRPAAPMLVRPARLGAVQTMQAMTVHRSQGSQFQRISVLLPAEGSPLLTRQLLYTAVTRAERHVRVIGSEAAVRAAVSTPITRASGLRGRLWTGG
ncbi:MAG TPA: exodeoxyribonuclease V subunit alpha [Frankiaceae bacterium]|jgi:exodeoxyribonuclease V alpha subunit|nr:exodeoxyribonuclease V subunit alpha [Frankiaceae bacterium]